MLCKFYKAFIKLSKTKPPVEEQYKELEILYALKEKVPGGLYKPERSMEIAAEGTVGLASVSSKCSTEVLLGDWEVNGGEEEN